MTNQSNPLCFEQWYERHKEELSIQLVEGTIDSELDSDSEEAIAQAYENYLIHFEDTE